MKLLLCCIITFLIGLNIGWHWGWWEKGRYGKSKLIIILSLLLSGCAGITTQTQGKVKVTVLEIANDYYGGKHSIEKLLKKKGFLVVEKAIDLDVDYYVTGSVWLVQTGDIDLPEIDVSGDYSGYESEEVAIAHGVLLGLAEYMSRRSYLYGSIRLIDPHTGQVVAVEDNIRLKGF